MTDNLKAKPESFVMDLEIKCVWEKEVFKMDCKKTLLHSCLLEQEKFKKGRTRVTNWLIEILNCKPHQHTVNYMQSTALKSISSIIIIKYIPYKPVQ